MELEKDFRAVIAAKINQVVFDGKEVMQEETVYSDKQGWYYYIPKDCVPCGTALLLKHYRGPFFVVISEMDYKLLEDGYINVEHFIEGAYWYYGYYQGGGSYISGASWQMLYSGSGLRNEEYIRKYLNAISCIVNNRTSGCKYDSSEYDTGMDILDKRKELVELLSERFKFQEVVTRTDVKHVTIENVDYGCAGGMFDRLVIPESLAMDMLFYPEKYSVSKLSELKVEIE